MQRDLVHFTATKLQGGWSAADFSRYLTAENLKQLLPRIDKFEPLVRVRILLSLLTLDKGVKQACHDELQGFLSAAREDKDEWVSITAKALGNLEPPLDFQGMLASSAVVRQTISDIEARLTDNDDTAFRPLEEAYLSTEIVTEARGGPELPITHQHFVPREGFCSSPQDFYSSAKASAASAEVGGVAVSSHSGLGHPSSSTPAGEGDSRDPGSHAAAAPEVSGRSAAVEDMFRSSRQQTSLAGSRNAPSLSGLQDRRGPSRPSQVKVLDVADVQKLNNADARRSRQPASPPEFSHTQAHTEAHSLETEEGEIEAGELCEDSYSEPSLKRLRVAHEAIV